MAGGEDVYVQPVYVGQGREKGLETGKYKTYYDLISDGTLTLKQAAEKCSLSPDEFQKKLIEFKNHRSMIH